MPDPDEKLTPADPEDLASGLAFALKFEGRKRWHDADAFMADIVAKRLVRYLSKVHSVDQWMRLGMRCRLSPTADVPSHTSGAAMCKKRHYARSPSGVWPRGKAPCVRRPLREVAGPPRHELIEFRLGAPNDLVLQHLYQPVY